MMNSIYSWTNKQYKEMSPKEYSEFKEAYRSIWHYYNVTNDYKLYAQDSKGKKIALDTDISQNKYLDIPWLHRKIDSLAPGEVVDFVTLFQSIMHCLIISNHEDFTLMNLER